MTSCTIRQFGPLIAGIACAACAGAARAEVVVNMPPPPALSARPAAAPEAESAPTVGEVALARYARARTRPYQTYGGWPWRRIWMGYYPFSYSSYFVWGTPCYHLGFWPPLYPCGAPSFAWY